MSRGVVLALRVFVVLRLSRFLHTFGMLVSEWVSGEEFRKLPVQSCPLGRYFVIRVRCDGELGVLIWRLIASDKRYIDLASVREGRHYTTARHTPGVSTTTKPGTNLTINYHNTQPCKHCAISPHQHPSALFIFQLQSQYCC